LEGKPIFFLLFVIVELIIKVETCFEAMLLAIVLVSAKNKRRRKSRLVIKAIFDLEVIS
jgi:hypothetical protein